MLRNAGDIGVKSISKAATAAIVYLPTFTNTVLPTRTDASQSPLPKSSITHKYVAYD